MKSLLRIFIIISTLIFGIETLFAATTLNSGVTTNSSVSQGQWKHYEISANGKTKIQVLLNNLNNDLDLYIRKNNRPIANHRSSLNLCVPYKGGTTQELCNETISASDTIYISVHGYSAGSFSLKATLSGGTTSTSSTQALQSGHRVNSSVSHKQWKHYKILANGRTKIQALLYNLSSDLDLYVRKNNRPVADYRSSQNLCVPYKGGTIQESCYKSISGSDIIYISVYGYTAGSFSIKATLSGGSTGSNGNENITSLGINSSRTNQNVVNNSWEYYKVTSSQNRKISVKITDLSADVDLYVQKNQKPTSVHTGNSAVKTSNLCIPFPSGRTSEVCTMTVNSTDTLYIGVHGANAGRYTIKTIAANTNSNTEALGYPFPDNESWTVCQGYNNRRITHHPAGPGYTHVVSSDLSSSFDMNTNPNSAPSRGIGCYGANGYSNGEEIYAPASGVISRFTPRKDMACINFDNDNLGSMMLGHFERYNGRKVELGEVVRKGETILGEIHENAYNAGTFAHIHMGLYSDGDCRTPRAFRTFFNDGQNYQNNGNNYQWRGTTLHRGNN